MEHSPPTNVARVRFPDPASNQCGLSLLLFLVLSSFPLHTLSLLLLYVMLKKINYFVYSLACRD